MPSTKALLARAAKFITGIASDTNWRLYSTMFDVDDIAEGITRLYRSQGFGDPDYPGCVHRLFQAIALASLLFLIWSTDPAERGSYDQPCQLRE